MMKYFCCDEHRRKAVENVPGWNGIDFLEVVDSDAPSLAERQRILRVSFINKPAPPNLVPANVAITGGERITGVNVDTTPSYDGDVLVVHVNKSGDFSTYTLSLVKADGSGEPLDGLDPLLSAIDFSFKVECHSDFDCLTKRICPPERQLQPEIDYLSKDYASFRQLMLDRMALLMPQWKERNAADIGIVLMELLAYVGDYLSYQQDAVATEAYLDTARSRISIRRHARLVDYFMNEGCNARVLVQVHVNPDRNIERIITLMKGTQLFTHVDGQLVCIPSDSPLYVQALAQNPEVFETMYTAMLFQAHNELMFYTWGARECCLPRGATRATLRGHFPDLKAGDLLIFTEVRDPKTGNTDDANPDHRHAVRLVHVISQCIDEKLQDKLGEKFLDNHSNNPVYITEIQWAPEDALPFPLCISATTDKEHGEKYLDDVSIALGNIVLADHGLTIKGDYLFNWDEIPGNGNENKRLIDFLDQTYGIDWVKNPNVKIDKIDNNTIKLSFDVHSLSLNLNNEKTTVNLKIDDGRTDEFIAKMENSKLNIYNDEFLGEVPKPTLFMVSPQAGDRCQERKIEQVPPRFSPHFKEKPLTFAVPFGEALVFSIDVGQQQLDQYENDLDSKKFSSDLEHQFTNQGIIFKNKCTPSIQGKRDIQSNIGEWSLSDGAIAYIVRKEDKKLNIYELPESANKVMDYTPQDALSAIASLISDMNGKTDDWTPQRDLLSSKPDATDFVVEIESDGTAYLRFGNYEPQNNNISSANLISQAHGLRPDSGTKFKATYRIGNGTSGNIGAEAIAHIVCDNQNIIDKVHNPLRAQGGVEPESIENVRQSAPSAFRIQERAVTEDDYAEVAERHPGVQRAAATFRWTGSWRTVFVAIDRLGGLPVDDNFKKEMREYLNRYLMAGYDIEVDGPIYVSLQIEMHVCVKPDYFRGDVEEALLQIFSNRVLPDGRKGVFYPDNFTFGQTVYLSPLYAAAQAVNGVSSVQVTTFQRQGIRSDEALKAGKLILGRLEIARLDNDPNFPENGVLSLILEGGK